MSRFHEIALNGLTTFREILTKAPSEDTDQLFQVCGTVIGLAVPQTWKILKEVGEKPFATPNKKSGNGCLEI